MLACIVIPLINGPRSQHANISLTQVQHAGMTMSVKTILDVLLFSGLVLLNAYLTTHLQIIPCLVGTK